jgi:tetratricopeptide (TPR) repeat protein
MYRRNITHILGPLALILALFSFYHAWLKPNYFPDPPPPVQKVIPEEPHQPLLQEAEETIHGGGTKRPRTIDPVTMPVPKHSDLLSAIHEELERGNASQAEARLSDIPTSVLAELPMRRHVAVLWNNLGILQERADGTEVSVKAFKKATVLDPKNAIAHLNLAHAYWGLRDPNLTVEFLKKVIGLAPEEPFAHVALADLLQEQNKLTEAGRHLQEATDRIRKDPGLQPYLKTVRGKVNRTENLGDKLIARNSAHFIVKFDGNEDHATWTTVLDILEEAYREIGQTFNHFPAKPITVVLLTRTTFQESSGSPGWADGLFDPVLGRIQVPTQGALTDKVWLTRVLRHEFVHAVIQDQLGSNSGMIPTWLNEGLAMQLAGDQWRELDQVLQGDIALVPLTSLEGSWEHLSAEAATVAYLEANSATHYLLERFGMHKLHEVLGLLKARQTLTTAMQDKLLLSYDHFQHQWADNFHAKAQHQKS